MSNSDTDTYTPAPIPALPENAAGWVEGVIPSLANDLTDRLVAMWPHTWEERDGDYGRKLVAVCHVWLLDGEAPEMYGARVPIRWQAVQRQLKASSDEAPWVVGTVKQKGRSYVIEPPAPSRRNAVSKALKVVVELIAMGAYDEQEASYGGDAHDEEPF